MSSIRVRRRVAGQPGPPAWLAGGELAFNEVDGTLYYGWGVGADGRSATMVLPLLGAGNANVMFSATAPANPTPGLLWFDPVGCQLYVWYDDGSSQQWVPASSAATAIAGYLLLTGGTMTGPLNATATGGSAVRSVQDRAADAANVLDYGAGRGGDDAAAIRAAIASGKRTILIPPGDYTMKSTVATGAPASNPCCILLLGRSDLAVIAYGARFLIDNAISGPAPTTTVAIGGDCKHVTWLGGTFIGNNTWLTPNDENCALECNSSTFLTIRDVKITGDFLTSFAGTWLFDCLFENIQTHNAVNAIDMAHLENVTFQQCAFFANPARPFTGANIHYDTPTLSANHVTTEAGAARALATGCTNQLRFLDCLFDGFGNGIAIDCVRGALLSRTIVRNGLTASSANTQCGVLLYRGGAAVSAGLPTTNIVIDDCDIYGNGVTAGGGMGCGVYIEATQVSVFNSRIHDNTSNGVATSNLGNVSGVLVAGCDFRSRTGGSLQTAAIETSLAGALTAPGSAVGVSRNNLLTATGGVADYLMVEGNSQSGVADADGKNATLRLTSNQNAGGFGGSIEFGARRANGGAGAQASGYFAALKGSLVDGSNNTLGTLDIYVRKVATDTALTKTGSFTATGLATDNLAINFAGKLTMAPGGPTIRAGNGVPVDVQPAGSLWMRSDGAVGSRIYVSAGAGTWAAIAGV